MNLKEPNSAFLDRFIDRVKVWLLWNSKFASQFLFPACHENPELERHARLIVWFGLIATLFEFIYAGFYLAIGHNWGAVIVALSGLLALSAPFLLRASRSLFWAGTLLLATMTGEFIFLCLVEGGLHGHAFAWLVCIPLCALLLVGKRGAVGWTLVSLTVAAVISGLALYGMNMDITYDPRWETLVTAVGYFGLIIFMFGLGLIFEVGREGALAKLQISNRKLKELNEEKNEFLGIAAHDMKNPLAAIMGLAEMLQVFNSPDKVDRTSKDILSLSHRMVELINNLLDVNAIEEGKLTSRIERCNLNSLASQCIENNRHYALQKQITLNRVEVPEIWTRVDRGAAMQILDNLVSNALKYSPSYTVVTVTTVVHNGQAELSVSDQGPGIDPEEQKLLFRKFSRLSTQPTAGESSSGLGLSIVKRLAEAMSGSVRCQSAPGHGATFTVSLPLW